MRSPVIYSSMVRISDLEKGDWEPRLRPREEWAGGDYVMVEVEGDPGSWTLELPTGRLIELAEGDRVIGALGRRHATLEATGSWDAVERDGRMHLLTGGGLLGRCTSRSTLIPPLPQVVYRGHLVREGAYVAMSDFVSPSDSRPPSGSRPPSDSGPRVKRDNDSVEGAGPAAGSGELPPELEFRIPTVMIIGTSMSAGKTATARVLIRRLRAMGLRVLGAKVTGAGRYRDVLTMADSGAAPIFDFVDAGLPSTVCPAVEYRRALAGLIPRMNQAPVDVAVVEVGASPLEPYNGTVAVECLDSAVRMTVLCATDPYAVLGLIRAYGRTPDLVTGIAANTRAGVELVQRLVGLPCLDIRRSETLAEVDRLLRAHLGLDGATGDEAP